MYYKENDRPNVIKVLNDFFNTLYNGNGYGETLNESNLGKFIDFNINTGTDSYIEFILRNNSHKFKYSIEMACERNAYLIGEKINKYNCIMLFESIYKTNANFNKELIPKFIYVILIKYFELYFKDYSNIFIRLFHDLSKTEKIIAETNLSEEVIINQCSSLLLFHYIRLKGRYFHLIKEVEYLSCPPLLRDAL
jgi:hypothetical protein